jgi:thiopeptide-type bacteriocin biosynthesis protein
MYIICSWWRRPERNSDLVRETVATLPSSELMVAEPRLAQVEGGLWGSWHLYKVDPDEYLGVVSSVIPPVVKKLSAALLVDRFFFLRYADEDGHHIRLRFRFRRECTNAADQVTWIVKRMVAENGLISVPRHFEPEVERYGGPGYLPLSLDFFCLSSMAALAWLGHHVDEPRSKQLPTLMGLLTNQAVASACSADELASLLDYFAGWKDKMGGVIQRGDRVFENRPEQFTSFLRRHFEATLTVSPMPLVEGARALSLAVSGLRERVRQEILQSQMHMTANRLGLYKEEESYVTRILRRAFDDLCQKDFTYIRELNARLSRQQPTARIDTVVNGCWEAQ